MLARLLCLLLLPTLVLAQPTPLGGPRYVAATKSAGSFPLVAEGRAAPLYVSEADWPGVQRAVRDVQADMLRVTGREPLMLSDTPTAGLQPVVLVGTLGYSPLLDGLVRRGKFDAAGLRGRREKFIVQAIDHPWPGVARALVVAGADQRGTIYGLYDLSAQMGVSPWYWWADVPVTPRRALYVAAGAHTLGEPAVRYRGLAFSRPDPTFAAWLATKGHTFSPPGTERLLELLLRLRANYLELPPPLAGDPTFPALAATYGVMLGQGSALAGPEAAEETEHTTTPPLHLWPLPAGEPGAAAAPTGTTLLLPADSQGQLLRLPRPAEAERPGGYALALPLDYARTPLPALRRQLHLAYEYGVRQAWIAHVGSPKQLELPLAFWFDHAWNPAATGPTDVAAYTRRWVARQFAELRAPAIAELLSRAVALNARRPATAFGAATYSLRAFREWPTVVADYARLRTQAEALGRQLPAADQAAYFELVQYPVAVGAARHELAYAAAQHREATRLGQANRAREFAAQAQHLLAAEATLTQRYHQLLEGKWAGLLPPPPSAAALPGLLAAMPSAPAATTAPRPAYVAFEAAHYSRAVAAAPLSWQVLPGLGRTLGAVTTGPVTAAPTATPGGNSPHLEYRFTLPRPGAVRVQAYLTPTPDFTGGSGLRYAVSLDGGALQLLSLPAGPASDAWEQAAAQHIVLQASALGVVAAGTHTLKFWRIDAGVVLEKLVVSQGELPASYLGPPEATAGQKAKK